MKKECRAGIKKRETSYFNVHRILIAFQDKMTGKKSLPKAFNDKQSETFLIVIFNLTKIKISSCLNMFRFKQFFSVILKFYPRK